MTKIAEIVDRSACATWSPIRSRPDLIVVGSKDSGGIGFEDTGGELELYDLHLDSSQGPELLVSVKTAVRFASVDWSPFLGNEGTQFPMGIIAGGMTDGAVHIWDTNAILQKTSTTPLFSLNDHANGPVDAVKFNPLEPSLLATGGVNGQVLVIDFKNAGPGRPPSVIDPTAGGKQSAKITAAAWNSQVPHILATSSGDGSVAVWDLKQCKSWCKLQVEHGPVSDILWNPTEGLNLLTASGDDRNPVIKVWDLGASTSMPLATMSGHSAAILKTSWCPHDDTILMTCGKDNRTLLWDLTTLLPFTELPIEAQEDSLAQAQAPAANALFATKSLNEQKHMRVATAWSPFKRGIALTCSLDRKVQVHTVLGLVTQSGRPPKWMKPASSVSTAFGGAFIFVGSKGDNNKVVTIKTIQEQPFLAKLAGSFEEQLTATSMIDFCENRRARANKGTTEEKTWGIMRVIFEENAREQLLKHLGYDAKEIADAASRYQNDTATNGVASMSLNDNIGITMSKGAEELVKKALLVGNFEAAVECCFRSGNLSDALLIASCGGAELWSKTQERYFELESKKRPYLGLVSNIVQNQLEALVQESDTSRWQETLAILATYGQSEEFPNLCILLGQRLEGVGDAESACLCYMCSLSVEHASRFWKSELEKSRKGKGSYNLVALHQLVVKVAVFLKAAGPGACLPEDVAELFAKYAQAVAEQGLFTIAAKYCFGNSTEINILKDRLYRSRESLRCLAELGAPPEFPFDMATAVRAKSAQTTKTITAGSKVYNKQKSDPYLMQQLQPYGQQSYTQQSYGQQAAFSQQQAAPSDQLPPGWIALQDPSSGLTYYANEQTGETTWDRPEAPKITSAPNSVSFSANSYGADPIQSSAHSTSSATKSQKAALVSKYGDGFVTSASHPELAYQYGNVGTSNPYHGSARPGTAASVISAKEQAPESGPLDLDSLELLPEHVPIKETLYALFEHLLAYANSSEKRQLEESKKGLDILMKKCARGQLEEEILAKVHEIVGYLSSHDFRMAANIQTALVNDYWRMHKDWLKGLKTLLQMASKKLSG